MTVERQNVSSGPYVPNGVTAAFPFDFHAASVAEVGIAIDGFEVDRALYTVNVNPDGTGSVSFFAPPTGLILVIYSAPLFTQEVNFEDQGPFYQASVNEPIDRSVLRDLVLRDELSRSITFPIGEAGLVLPPASERAGGTVLGFDAITGNPVIQGAGAFKGDPGGNVMSIGLFSIAQALSIPLGTDIVQTKGHGLSGIGVAQYVNDAAVNAAYVVANPRTSFISQNGRGFRLVAEGWVDVTWFGARGDDQGDDSDAIQAMVNFLKGRNGGTGFFPRGDYRLTKPIVCGNNATGLNRVILRGAGGVGFGGAFPKTGARIYGMHAGDLFQFASCSYVVFENLTFDGSGCTAIRQTGSPTVDYLENLWVTDCHFFGALAECIYGNLIYAKIFRNSFGYFGTVGASHRHIRCQGTGTNTANSNRIVGNRFYYAKGSESVRFDSASDLVLSDNNWEQNRALPLRLNGAPASIVERNWFEMNSLTTAEIELNAGSSLIDSNPTVIQHNTFVPHATTARIVQLNTTLLKWAFLFNSGDGTGKQLANDTTKLASRLGNNLTGLPIPDRIYQEGGSWNVTDASSAGLSIPAAGVWERDGNHVDCHVDFTFPTNSNNANVKIGGFPYPSGRVAVGAALSNIGVRLAMDAGAGTATFYDPVTLTPLTNAALSGRPVYLTIRYPV